MRPCAARTCAPAAHAARTSAAARPVDAAANGRGRTSAARHRRSRGPIAPPALTRRRLVRPSETTWRKSLRPASDNDRRSAVRPAQRMALRRRRPALGRRRLSSIAIGTARIGRLPCRVAAWRFRPPPRRRIDVTARRRRRGIVVVPLQGFGGAGLGASAAARQLAAPAATDLRRHAAGATAPTRPGAPIPPPPCGSLPRAPGARA